MMSRLILAVFFILQGRCQARETRPAPHPPAITVRSTDDFELTGDGKNSAWRRASWNPLRGRPPGLLPYNSRFKILHSKTGLYVLFNGDDAKLTTTGRLDFEKLWEEDVFEAFFWTDESAPVYLEYEISPLGSELALLIANADGSHTAWRPWQYENARKCRKATAALGGPKKAGAAVKGWSAEFFIPFEILRGLKGVPPKPGARWRANFYRVDYDEGKKAQWEWAPVGPSFHEHEKFGTLIFR